jgi:hypothetical protein
MWVGYAVRRRTVYSLGHTMDRSNCSPNNSAMNSHTIVIFQLNWILGLDKSLCQALCSPCQPIREASDMCIMGLHLMGIPILGGGYPASLYFMGVQLLGRNCSRTCCPDSSRRRKRKARGQRACDPCRSAQSPVRL